MAETGKIVEVEVDSDNDEEVKVVKKSSKDKSEKPDPDPEEDEDEDEEEDEKPLEPVLSSKPEVLNYPVMTVSGCMDALKKSTDEVVKRAQETAREEIDKILNAKKE